MTCAGNATGGYSIVPLRFKSTPISYDAILTGIQNTMIGMYEGRTTSIPHHDFNHQNPVEMWLDTTDKLI